MLLSVAGSLLLSLSLVNPVAAATMHCARGTSNSCDNSTTASPVRYGFLLPRSFSVMDVFGPLEILQALARQTHLELSLLSRTLDPAKTEPVSPAMNKFNSSFFPMVVPTHTYADNPPLDVLVIPGGAAARNPDIGPEIAYIQKVFPQLQYLVTICTGAAFAAQAGVLDGHRATTNKAAWNTITPMGPNVKWVSPARWVEDGKVWTSSGVTAGMDLTFEFIRQKYDNGTAIAEFIAGNIEHVMITDWRDDEGFGDKFNVPHQN